MSIRGCQKCNFVLERPQLFEFEVATCRTTYSINIRLQKCAGICGLWVLNEIIKKIYPENMKKIVGVVWKLPAK